MQGPPPIECRFHHFSDLGGIELNSDLHIHTSRTDGLAEVGTLTELAVQRGLQRIAFTEHVRRNSDWFPDFAREVRAQRTKHSQLEILVGCEAKALDKQGSIDASPAVLGECDIVLGSVHRFPDGGGGFLDTRQLTEEAFAREELELALGLLRHAPVHVLAHPGGMYARRHGRDLPVQMLRQLMLASLERGVAVEINASYVHDMSAFLGMCQEINPRVSIGSDVHQLDDLGRCRDRLLAQRAVIA
jgi:putative hydrolase